MVYLVTKEAATAAVERINTSGRSLQTSYELEMGELRHSNPQVSKAELLDGKLYGLISLHLDASPARAYLEVWRYYAKGTYSQTTDMLVAENAWGQIGEKKVAAGMVLCEI